MPRARALLIIAVALAAAACGSSSHGPATAAGGKTTPSTAAAATTPQQVSQPGAGTTGPEGVTLEEGPFLASPATTAPGTPVDGIQCAPIEQLAYHIHAHLQVYLDGQPRALPPAIGLLGPVYEQTANGLFYGAVKCYYWLHTHAGDGVIHIESPTVRIYTLGEFFDEWGQPLSSNQVASASGPVTAFLNGRPWTQSPRAIPLLPHAAIQLDVGKPIVAFHGLSWVGTGL